MCKRQRLDERLVAGERHAQRGDAGAEVVSGAEHGDAFDRHSMDCGVLCGRRQVWGCLEHEGTEGREDHEAPPDRGSAAKTAKAPGRGFARVRVLDRSSRLPLALRQ